MARITIHRTRIGRDIVAEFAVPLSAIQRKKGRVAVLATGAPSMPGKSALIEFLSQKGFYVVSPRYRGSWESGGTFLSKEPTADIREVINALKRPLISLYEGKAYVFPKKLKVYIFASSFGGPAGFLLSKDERVKKVVLVSPVCDWRVPSKVEPLETAHSFVKKAYGEGYRIANNGYTRLAKGNFYNPATALHRVNGETCLIFHARNDEVVPFRSVFDFAYQTGATLKASNRGGHLGLSEICAPETWREIALFLRK